MGLSQTKLLYKVERGSVTASILHGNGQTAKLTLSERPAESLRLPHTFCCLFEGLTFLGLNVKHILKFCTPHRSFARESML
jgi:hypothetical protein